MTGGDGKGRGGRRRAGDAVPGDARAEPAVRVYKEISDAILEQRLKPGTKLGEQMLSDIFGVNRPVIRRALMRLSYESLVDIRPHRGAFVASPTPEEARQVFEARRVIEDWAVRACAERAGAGALEALRRHTDIEAEAARKGERMRWIRLSGEFHVELAKAAGNGRIVGFLEDLVAQTSLIIGLYGTHTDSICCNDEHHRIVAAIDRGDRDGAVEEMMRHLETCEAALRFHEDGEADDLHAIFGSRPRAGRRGAGAKRSRAPLGL